MSLRLRSKLRRSCCDVLLRACRREDVFDFNAVAETGKTATTRDVITDFVHLTDKINLSLIDAAGYVLAQHLELPFVTGDKSFESLKGVDFRPAET